MTFKHTLMLTCSAAVALAAANSAWAQAAKMASPAASSATIEEVIVTAQKRTENLQSVAATVEAVSSTTIERRGVKELNDITKVVPEVRVLPGPFANITIRGIRTGTFGPSTDSPNALHVDGVYMSRFTGLQGFFYDLERVEVLAGPQGTLYGRNSAGGTLNIITRKPGDEFGGHASFEVGNYDQMTANLAINIPLTDTLAVRGAYYHNAHRGFADTGLDDNKLDSARLSARWRPTPNDTLLITADRELLGGRGFAPNLITQVLKQPTILTSATGTVSLVPAGTPGGVIVPISVTNDPRGQAAEFGAEDLNRWDTKSGGAMAQYDHDFGWATLTGQASYRTTSTNNAAGYLTQYPQDPRLVTTPVLRPVAPSQVLANSEWNAQELRLTSPANQTVTYVVGLYHFHENSHDNHNLVTLVSYPNTSAATVGQFIVSNPQILATDIANPKNLDDAYAAFGQATYTPQGLEALHLTAGLRYNHEKKQASGYEVLNGVKNPTTVFDQTAEWSATTYKLNAAYDITAKNLVYFDHSTGFKSGGFAYGQTPQYEPEKIKSYEIGTKNRFLDDKLQVNASAWHYDYTNFTTTILQFYFDTNLGRPNAIINTANAGKAKVDGQTISIDAVLTPDDTLSLTGTHLRAQYTQFDVIARQAFAISTGFLVPGATNATFDYSGTPIGNVPDWAGTATYDHIFHVAGGELDAQLSVNYTGERLFANQASRADVNGYIVGKGYATGDFSLQYRPDARKWSVTAYVRNLTNEDVVLGRTYVSNANFLPVADPRVTFAYRTTQYGAPRTFGVIFSADF